MGVKYCAMCEIKHRTLCRAAFFAPEVFGLRHPYPSNQLDKQVLNAPTHVSRA